MSLELGMRAEIKKAKEKNWNWLEVATSYEQALRSESKKVSFAAETWESIGFCYSQASTQAEDLEDFGKLRLLAVKAYKSAAQLFRKEGSLNNQGKSAQCNAIAAYLDSWLASSPSEKRERLDECRLFGNNSLEAYEKAGDQLSYGKMCNDLLRCLLEKLYVAPDWREMKNTAQEGIDYADKAIGALSKLGNKSELLRAYFTASLQNWYAANISDQEEKRKRLMQRSLDYSKKALEISKEVDNPYYAAMANWAAASCTLLFTEKIESALEYAKETLRQGMIVKDNYLKGVASYILAFVTNWMVLREGDPEKKKEGHEKIIKYAKDGIRYLQLVSQDYFIAETYLFYAESYSSQARDFEASTEEKRNLLEKAVEIGRKGLEHATHSGSSEAEISTLHALSKALHFYSNLETEKDEKTKLLEEALAHRKIFINVVEETLPFNDWIRGVGENYEGLIKVDLARLQADRAKKIAFLESAIANMEDSVSHCRKWILSHPVPTRIVAVARYEDWFGEILNELYLLTEDKELLTRAIEVYEAAANKFKKANLSSRVAESYWKIARNQDLLEKHQKAAENFEKAFAEYTAAAQKIPHFADFYLNYATYMKAWSEIERAGFAHKNDEYAIAMKHYEKTASLLKQSELWSYLSSNFHAWALLEQAEDLSRKESIESIEAFKKAAQLFKQAKEDFEEEINKIKVPDEKEKAIELSKASSRRRDYCLARANVEQARTYDRKGNYAKSAEEYDLAAATLEKILETTKTETYRKEIEPIAYMCRAWQKMKMADGTDSPELYHEASELFLRAKEYSEKDRTSLLASGNSALCKALEFGTKFEATRDKDDFTKAKQFLVSAANYYLKAGFEHASLWTGATEILFDAFNYMSNAEIEVDPEKRTKIYLLAEKCLERSVGLYEHAGYIGKRDEVLKTLKRVKEKREFALSLGELLDSPGDASSTNMISTLGLTVEEPVGFSKFEGAFVQANLVANKREVVVGENFRFEIHLANLGKDTAYLIKVEEITTEGFHLIEKPERCIFDDGCLNFKGRKLAALETEEIKLEYRSKKKGKFVFKPKIQYMNEAGEYKFCELEHVTVNVKQLGIRGWLKGPG